MCFFLKGTYCCFFKVTIYSLISGRSSILHMRSSLLLLALFLSPLSSLLLFTCFGLDFYAAGFTKIFVQLYLRVKCKTKIGIKIERSHTSVEGLCAWWGWSQVGSLWTEKAASAGGPGSVPRKTSDVWCYGLHL